MEHITYFEQFDACVTDACTFLKIDRREFYILAREWKAFSNRFGEFDDPQEFYKSWKGDSGAANICANIVDQFTREHLMDAFARLPHASGGGNRLRFADIGCGTAAISFPVARQYAEAYLVDVPNRAQEFAAWRCRIHGLHHMKAVTIEALGPVDIMVSIDVLEHIADATAFFKQMNNRLLYGGILVLQAPWYSFSPHPEHLPAAEESWNAPGGGRDILEQEFDVLERWSAWSGMFMKKKPS